MIPLNLMDVVKVCKEQKRLINAMSERVPRLRARPKGFAIGPGLPPALR